MTKSKGIGRRGKVGNKGGRPRKIPLEPIKQAAVVVAPGERVDLDALTEKALRALEYMIDNPSRASTPVVSAAKAILMASTVKGNGPVGKKMVASARAEQRVAVGRFAVPPPPKMN